MPRHTTTRASVVPTIVAPRLPTLRPTLHRALRKRPPNKLLVLQELVFGPPSPLPRAPHGAERSRCAWGAHTTHLLETFRRACWLCSGRKQMSLAFARHQTVSRTSCDRAGAASTSSAADNARVADNARARAGARTRRAIVCGARSSLTWCALQYWKGVRQYRNKWAGLVEPIGLFYVHFCIYNLPLAASMLSASGALSSQEVLIYSTVSLKEVQSSEAGDAQPRAATRVSYYPGTRVSFH